jgi:exodeoxyribonuclease VII small subunit
LEELVDRLEDRNLGLDQALAAFEEGLCLSAALRKKLDEAAGRVEKLTRDMAGRPLTEPMEPPLEPEAGDDV